MVESCKRADAPELGLGADSISGPKLHAVGGRGGVLCRRQMAAHHLVLVPLEDSLQQCTGEAMHRLETHFPHSSTRHAVP